MFKYKEQLNIRQLVLLLTPYNYLCVETFMNLFYLFKNYLPVDKTINLKSVTIIRVESSIF